MRFLLLGEPCARAGLRADADRASICGPGARCQGVDISVAPRLTMDDRAASLHATPPFHTLDNGALAMVADVAQTRSYPAGATILGEATPASAFAHVIC